LGLGALPKNLLDRNIQKPKNGESRKDVIIKPGFATLRFPPHFPSPETLPRWNLAVGALKVFDTPEKMESYCDCKRLVLRLGRQHDEASDH